LFLTYIVLYSCLRFVVEFFRGDVDRGFIAGGISVSQGISVIAGFAALMVIVWKILRRKQDRAL
jgi:phosphatidylglycerol:prolipoprotein diacylglycerol transferase